MFVSLGIGIELPDWEKWTLAGPLCLTKFTTFKTLDFFIERPQRRKSPRCKAHPPFVVSLHGQMRSRPLHTTLKVMCEL
jgi:hypothetical protein